MKYLAISNVVVVPGQGQIKIQIKSKVALQIIASQLKVIVTTMRILILYSVLGQLTSATWTVEWMDILILFEADVLFVDLILLISNIQCLI